MLLIRRLWLVPAVFITLVVVWVYQVLWQLSLSEEHHYETLSANLYQSPESYERKYPISSFLALPTGIAKALPKIQHEFSHLPESDDEKNERLQKLGTIKESFLHAWNGYKAHAWMQDEVCPLSGKGRHKFGGWGATLVDSMDTLWIMGSKDEFELCVEGVRELDFTTITGNELNVFETTIRYLGGLLSAYDLSERNYPILLVKARELADVLYIPFDTPNHMPIARWKWRDMAVKKPGGEASSTTLIAELGSLTLEFTRLSQLTGEPKYFDAVQRISAVLAESQDSTLIPGLWPTSVDAKNLKFNSNHFTWGAMADSAYEYLPKEHLLLGGLDGTYENMYLKAVEAAKKYLFYRPLTPQSDKILFSGTASLDAHSDIVTEAQGQHLTCFAGGMVGIASQIFARPEDLGIARELVDGCIWAYSSMPSGLMPETFYIASCHVGTTSDVITGVSTQSSCHWSDDRYYEAIAYKQPKNDDLEATISQVDIGKWWQYQLNLTAPYTEIGDPRYILRPEAIESIFVLYRITGDRSLLDSAWTMFKAIETATRTEIAHAEVSDVRQSIPPKLDRMESFWLAETLKYFFLLFSDPDVVNLDEWVLNTEAHPFRRPKPGEPLLSI